MTAGDDNPQDLTTDASARADEEKVLPESEVVRATEDTVGNRKAAPAAQVAQATPVPAAKPGADMPEALGRYTLLKLLGRGGFGTVFLGYDSQLGRKVAIKVPHLRASSSETEKQFLKEARQLAQLKHPGIVTVFDVGLDGGRGYIVSDYLDGQTLHDWLKSHWPTWQESARIAAELAEALAHAHAHRTVHRDLKPGNIILTEGLRPVLVDFGLAVSDVQAASPQRGIVSGTPSFMSPEQTRGEGHRIDGRTDIWALGVILYRMLTGRLPFQAAEVAEVLRQIQRDEPQPPRQLVHNIPRALEQACLKALAKPLHERYTTAGDMADDLRQVLQSTPTERPVPEGPPTQTVTRSEDLSPPLDQLQVEAPPNDQAAGDARAPDTPAPATPSAQRRAREAERRRVTMLQCGCDLFASDAIAETLDPEEQHEVLLGFQRLCREAAERLQGTVVKSTENGLLICFGFPVALEDAARRAVRAGLAVRDGMSALNEGLHKHWGVALNAAVAVHSDQAVVKEQGGEGEALSIVGQVLTVVDQLEGLADPGTVLISQDTYRLVKGCFSCEERGAQRLKGLAAARETYRVLSERAPGSRVDLADPGGLTPLIGRDREIGLLQERWEQAAEGLGQVVLLSGEAGIGKSRLVHMLKEHVVGEAAQGSQVQPGRSQPEPVIEWRCLPHCENSTFYPAIEGFERILGFGRNEAHAQKLERLVAHLTAFQLGGDEEIGLLASLLSIPLEGRVSSLDLNPQRQKEKTLDLLLEWLREYARRQPVLFVVEDLQWVDPSTLEFLEALIDQGLHDRILALFTVRPDFAIPWQGKERLTQVALSRLTRRQIGEMMRLKAGVQKIPQDVVDRIAARTEGVPLFVEEFTTMVLEAGTLRQVDGAVEMSDSFPVHEIPATLQDLLMARLDRLASNLDVVQLAATVGREVAHELLQAVTPLPEIVLNEELAKLVAAGLLFQRGRPPRVIYQFKHALIQDAAYQSLLKKKRQQLHQRIAEALRDKFPEAAGQQPELLAHHFTEAGLVPQAVDYWELAGERCLKRYAHREAIGHLTRGLEMLRTLPEDPERQAREVKLHISLGVPLQSTRGYSAPEVEANYARAHALCRQVRLTAQLFPVLYGLFRYCMLQAKYARALELGEQLRTLADQAQNPGFVVAAHRALGATLVYQGEHARALPHLNQVLAVPATPELRAVSYQYDVVDQWITARSYLAWTLWLQGYPDQARAHTEEAIATARSLDHPFSMVLALSFASWLYQFCGETERVRATAEKLLDISTQKGFAFWIGWGQVLHAWTLAETGAAPAERAATELRQGLAAWRAQGSELGSTYFLELLAEVCARAGRIDEGLAALAEARAFAAATGEGYWRPEIHRLEGELLLKHDPARAPEAEQCFQTAFDLARRQQARSLELRAAMSLARLERAQDRPGAARALLAEVYDGFTEGCETLDLKQAKALLTELS
jgi:TOMM system kinase/cyclase fusion protein